MRNTERLLGSLSLFCHWVTTLEDLNNALSAYGDQNARDYDRITIKEQQTDFEKKNISVHSFQGTVTDHNNIYALNMILSIYYQHSSQE